MNQRRIEAFRAVMLSGSITGGAQQLNISQPAVSRLIADFEAEINLKLFVRAGGNLTATEEAHRLLEDVEFFFRGLESVYRAAKDIKELKKGRVRLAVMPNLSFDTAPSIVTTFLEKYDNVNLTMDVLAASNIANLVAARHFDLGLAQVEHKRHDLRILGKYRLRCVCVVSNGHRLAGFKEVSAQDLAEEKIVALSSHTLVAHQIKQAFLKANISPRIIIESQPSFAACALVVKGLGVSIIDTQTAEFFGPNRVTAIPFVPEVPFDFCLFEANHVVGNRISKEFAEQAKAILESNPNIEVI